jgi:hypothetical protein
MKRLLAASLLALSAVLCLAQEFREGRYIFLSTSIDDDRVNVRDAPSLGGKVLARLDKGAKVIVRGMAEGRDLIEGKRGYWLFVDYGKSGYAWGWVYAAYVRGCADLKPRSLVASAWEPEKKYFKLKLESVGAKDRLAHSVFLMFRDAAQDFYTFFVSEVDGETISYDELIGTYAWFPDARELRYLTYLTQEGNMPFCVTSDLEYALITDPLPSAFSGSAVSVYRLSDGKKVFEGLGQRPYDLKGHSLDIRVIYSSATSRSVDAESRAYALEFLAERKANGHSDSLPSYGYIVVMYRVDLETLSREFIGCGYDELPELE